MKVIGLKPEKPTREMDVPLDEIGSTVAGLGVPGLVLILAINATGYAGAAAFTAALSAIGPGGMIGGVLTLIISAFLVKGLSQFGFEKVFAAVLEELKNRGESTDSIKEKIDGYPIAKGTKLKLIEKIDALG